MLIKVIQSLYINTRLFYALTAIILCLLLSYWFNRLFPIGLLALAGLGVLLIVDGISLWGGKDKISAQRLLPEKLSNSDQNDLSICIHNHYRFSITVEVIEEIPIQFQKRDFKKILSIVAKEKATFNYKLRPVERGEYVFGKLNVYTSSGLKLLKRRYTFKKDQMVKVYPSFIQMKKYAFLALDNRLSLYGMKKIRRIGQTMEFEQIKDYVAGDDARTINWKATAKRASLMINQFQDEKSQPIYSLIDTSRAMKMPFNGLTLLDYAINSTLAFSNIALTKKDKVGIITFAEGVKNHLSASSKKTHLTTILEALYSVETKFLDSNFGFLYNHVKRKITQRSLLLLYTNFEHKSAMERQMGYLKALSRKHILVVIFFKNTELDELVSSPAKDIQTIYHKTIAQKLDYEQKVMAITLEKHGIQSILTSPEDLTINTINKYLQIKARGIL